MPFPKSLQDSSFHSKPHGVPPGPLPSQASSATPTCSALMLPGGLRLCRSFRPPVPPPTSPDPRLVLRGSRAPKRWRHLAGAASTSSVGRRLLHLLVSFVPLPARGSDGPGAVLAPSSPALPARPGGLHQRPAAPGWPRPARRAAAGADDPAGRGGGRSGPGSRHRRRGEAWPRPPRLPGNDAWSPSNSPPFSLRPLTLLFCLRPPRPARYPAALRASARSGDRARPRPERPAGAGILAPAGALAPHRGTRGPGP